MCYLSDEIRVVRIAEVAQRAPKAAPARLALNNRCDAALKTEQRALNWFTEGFNTADLKDAKALLDELST
jgi:hypothetical protein